MISVTTCASSENPSAKLSKTDWLDIAVVGELDEQKALIPQLLLLLKKARAVAAPLRVKVSLVLIGSGIAEIARGFYRFGADRVFAYDAPQLSIFDAEKYSALLSHFTREYKPSLLLFPQTTSGERLIKTFSEKESLLYFKAQEDFQLAPNKDVQSASLSADAAKQIANARPQLLLIPAGLFTETLLEPDRKGELILCEIPDAASV